MTPKTPPKIGSRRSRRSSSELQPASALALAIGLTWFGLGGGMNAAVLAVALLGPLLILYYNRSIGRLVGPLPVSTTDAIAARR
jgi:hypothetical protein